MVSFIQILAKFPFLNNRFDSLHLKEADWVVSSIDSFCATCQSNQKLLMAHIDVSQHDFFKICTTCLVFEERISSPKSSSNWGELGTQIEECIYCLRAGFVDSIDPKQIFQDNTAMSIETTSQQDPGTKYVPVLSLSQYFKQDVTLSIPPWQREYTWDATSDEGQVGVLLDDLRQFFDDESSDEYLLGAVITCRTDDDEVRYLIDGQQRTVTLTLLIMCCYQYLMEHKLVSAKDHGYLDHIYRMITKSSHGYNPRVRFYQENANAILAQIWDWMNAESDKGEKFIEETEAYNRTQNNLLSVVTYIRKRLKDESWFKKDEIADGLLKIVNGVKIIQLGLGDTREAIRAYDRINHRGLQLSDADLIKNQLFEKVDDKTFETISESWQNMVSTLNDTKSSKFQDPKYLIRAYAWTLWDKKVTYDELADRYKEVILDDASALKFAQTLEKLAETFVSLLKCKHPKFGDLPLLYAPQMLGSVQHYPVLLAGSGISDKDTFLHLYRQVACRTLLYVLSKERPPEFESYIPKWATAIQSAGSDVSIKKLDEIFEAHAFGEISQAAQAKKNRIDALHAQIDSWRVNNSSDKKKIRASLAIMSWWLDQIGDHTFPDVEDFFRTRVKKGDKKGWDIEHIAALGDANIEVPLDQKQSIGNLSLLSPKDQRAAKNAPPKEKMAIYDHSVLHLSKSVTGKPITANIDKTLKEIYAKCQIAPEWSLADWGVSSIESRAAFYKQFMTLITTREIEDPSQ